MNFLTDYNKLRLALLHGWRSVALSGMLFLAVIVQTTHAETLNSAAKNTQIAASATNNARGVEIIYKDSHQDINNNIAPNRANAVETIAYEPSVTAPKVSEPKDFASKIPEPKILAPKILAPKVLAPKVSAPLIMDARMDARLVPAKPAREFLPKIPQGLNNISRVPASGERAIIHKLEFKDANMLDVLRALSDMSGLNIVATNEATKNPITIYLQNITVKDALDTITKNSGLWYRQDVVSKTYRIMSTEEYQRDVVVYREDATRIFNLLHPNPVIVATAIRDIFPSRVQLSLGVTDISTENTLRQATTRTTETLVQNPVTTIVRDQDLERQSEQKVATDKMSIEQLARLDAAAEKTNNGRVSSDELRKISASEQPIYITLNREHNLIVVRTSDNLAMKEIERLIKEMDRPTPQVLLEMKILALDVSDSFRQSFSIDYAGGRKSNGPLDGVSMAKNILGLGSGADEGGTFVYQFMNDNIRARLELLEEKNKVSTLSSPLLLASNNKPAKVFVGVEQVITTGFQASGGAITGTAIVPTSIVPTTEVRNIGNTLQIVPKINADKTVTLSIQQDSSSVIIGGASIPIPVGNLIQYFNVDTVKTSNIEGTVVAKDGLTVAIGGLIDSSITKNLQQVPVLGDIPVLGNLFKRTVENKTKRELILLITPHIIMSPPLSEEVTRDAVEKISQHRWERPAP